MVTYSTAVTGWVSTKFKLKLTIKVNECLSESKVPQQLQSHHRGLVIGHKLLLEMMTCVALPLVDGGAV